jgi:hypothetical protein
MSEIKTCCFCAHAAHGPGGCDNCAPKRGCNRPPAYVTGAAATLGRLGGKAGRGEAKRRGDSAYYRALRRRDYVADRRQYHADGTRDYTSGGWAVMAWDPRVECYREPGAYYRSKREALDALRERR